MSSSSCAKGALRIGPLPTCSRNIVCRRARRPSPLSVIRFLARLSGHTAAPHENARRLLPSQMAEWLHRLNQSQRRIRPSQEPPADSNGGGTPQIRSRGPRIAQIRKLKPDNTMKRLDSHPQRQRRRRQKFLRRQLRPVPQRQGHRPCRD